jgi:hypothetical protein
MFDTAEMELAIEEWNVLTNVGNHKSKLTSVFTIQTNRNLLVDVIYLENVRFTYSSSKFPLFDDMIATFEQDQGIANAISIWRRYFFNGEVLTDAEEPVLDSKIPYDMPDDVYDEIKNVKLQAPPPTPAVTPSTAGFSSPSPFKSRGMKRTPPAGAAP